MGGAHLHGQDVTLKSKRDSLLNLTGILSALQDINHFGRSISRLKALGSKISKIQNLIGNFEVTSRGLERRNI